jgi:hypothetical protein
LLKAIKLSQEYAHIDSLKYLVYKNKLNDLIQNSPNTVAGEYKKGADYYFLKANQIRKKANTETNLTKKHKLLEKANEFEKIALENQEIALKTVLGKNNDIFLSTGCLMKLDPMLLLDQEIPTKQIESLAFDKIAQQIKLTHDDIKYLNDLPQYTETERTLEQSLFFTNEDLQKLQNKLKSTTTKSAKKKLSKEINKKKEEIINLKLSIAENQEAINDIKYYTLYNHLKEHRKKGKNHDVLQARQLEKNAIKNYKKAKLLRDKAYMLEETDINKAFEYNKQAFELENKGLSLMTQAYTAYMNIDENKLKQEIIAQNKKQSPISKLIAENKKADISEPSNYNKTTLKTDTLIQKTDSTITSSTNNNQQLKSYINHQTTSNKRWQARGPACAASKSWPPIFGRWTPQATKSAPKPAGGPRCCCWSTPSMAIFTPSLPNADMI